MSLMAVHYLNQNISQSFRYKICNDVLFTSPVVIYTRKNFFLLDALNAKIEILKSAGLIEFWQLQNIDENVLKTKEPDFPQALSVGHIMGSLYILFIGSFASFVALICEIIYYQKTKIISI